MTYGRQRLYDFRTPSEEINADVRPWTDFIYKEEQRKREELREKEVKEKNDRKM